MKKLVVLKLDGNLEEKDFRVTLEIGEYGHRPQLELVGTLPANRELAEVLKQHWLENYRPLGAPYSRKLKPKEIIYGSKIQDCKKSGEKVKDRFNSWLRSQTFADIYNQLLANLNREDEIHFLIRTEDKNLQKLPWHLWNLFSQYDATEPIFSTLSLSHSPDRINLKNSDKVKVLVILGHQEGINIDVDAKIIKSLPNIDPVFLVEPQRYQINEQLWEASWDIIFFAGHSETELDTGEGKFYINPTESLTIDELWYGLKKAVDRGLKLAIFNSCDGLGLAQRLNDLSIPQMIVMRELVPDRVAHEFLKHFLGAFSRGNTLENAVREARERLQGLENEFPCATWLPIVYQNPGAESLTWDNLIGIKSIEKEEISTLSKRWTGWPKVVATSLICTGLVMGVRSLGLLQNWEWESYDHLMQLRPSEQPDSRLLLVEVKERDIDKYGHPLPDEIIAQAISKLQDYKPRAIGMNFYRHKHISSNIEKLEKQIKTSDRLITPCTLGDSNKENIAPFPTSPEKQLGYSDLENDKKYGIVRRILLSRTANLVSEFSSCNIKYSFSLRLALRSLKEQKIEVSANQQIWQIGEAKFQRLGSYSGGYQRHDDSGHQILINYRNASPLAQTISLSDLLSDRFDPDKIRDKVVLMGVIAPSVQDNHLTPLGEMRGLHIQAQIVSSILSTVLDKRPQIWWFPWWGDTIWLGVWSAIGGILVWQGRYWFKNTLSLYLTLTFSFSLTILFASCWVFFLVGGWLPLIPASLGLLLSGMAIAILPMKIKSP
ncbi:MULTISPECIES: CHASE2 domain-containing protein [Spirulina sp. CCY15215]|uniref:CHASE2 domain-containing protein n=1 Tax=Spirulina sp. CCY15215 TaxID=2767591 RepID=UPI0019523937|nr:CHASE2 domain-containing protein [Spirulina major]